jgi:hypothetical protein
VLSRKWYQSFDEFLLFKENYEIMQSPGEIFFGKKVEKIIVKEEEDCIADETEICPLCNEKFEKYWNKEDWYLKGTIKNTQNIIVHKNCISSPSTIINQNLTQNKRKFDDFIDNNFNFNEVNTKKIKF